MSITHITSLSQLNGILSKANDKLSVIDFHATWCGPCHMIAPTFEALSKQYTNVNFLKCDVDAANEVAGYYKVGAMPTFIFLKGSTKVDELRGADKAGLERKVRQHASGGSSSTGAFSGKGQTLSGSSPKPDIKDAIPAVQNLDPQVKLFLALLGAYLLFWYLS
ncbi:thioredoxin-domain-containing protein [Heliocybe sulcata]|uniref:Thioredoxin n=1 Tax=Heliocybe sulcata TaxID=5364 RepID=A0A5C3NFP3_9AGAM|nr:thioredoxin-domain-containing protein [Heliocybe sulcata]